LQLHALAVAISPFFSCARFDTGEVLCWGTYSGLGRGLTAGNNYAPGHALYADGGPVVGVTELRASVTFACAVLADGSVVCWGGNDYGQLGDPSNTKGFAQPIRLP
jgi:hypothetical protein